MCQMKEIRSKPNFYFHDFQDGCRSISFSWILFNMALVCALLLYLPSFMSITYLLQLLRLFEIFYRNPTSVIFKMAAVPANFNFQIGSIAENVLHDIYYY